MPRNYTRRPIEERFWEKVDRSGGPDACWLWQASCRNGYGQFGVRAGKIVVASHFAYELAYGPLSAGMFALHNCPGGDNPRCVNPRHLYAGTQQDNVRDCVAKGRHSPGKGAPCGERNGTRTHPEAYRGSRNAHARLSEAEVGAMRAYHAEHHPQFKDLGMMFGVGAQAAHKIVSGQRWKHV